MITVQKHLAIYMLLVSCALAQNTSGTATVQNVTAAADGSSVRVEITLSSPVQPTVETAVNPDRILLDFPGTSTPANTKKEVNINGVRRVRTGQHSTAPPMMRVVLDLEQARSYTTKVEGNRIIVMVGPALNSGQTRSSGPAPPISLGLSGIFRRKPAAPQSTNTDQTDTASISLPTSTPASSSSPTSGPMDTAKPSPAPPFSGTQAAGDSQMRDGSVATGGFPSATGSTPAATAKAPVAGTALDTNVDHASRTNQPVDEKAADVKPGASSATESGAVDTSAGSGKTAMMLVRSDDPNLRTVFRVKYVADGIAYLEGGRAQGLAEGMKLEVKDTNLPARQGDSASADDPQVIAELEVSGVAETSAVTDIHTPKRPVKAGDLAYLSSADAEALVAQRALSSTRQYPAVISFSEGDTLDEEAREEVPRPPLPSVNRARGRIGLDYITTVSQGTASSLTSSNLGFAFQGDITRIGGSYWNLSGYYRGRFTSQNGGGVQTVQDLINHTYHLSMTYDNPNSSLVAGFGRLYLPWASSLDTIDGGYFGKRLGKGATAGIFGGSTPDPTSWSYSPDRVIGGGFINFDGGSYENWHYSSTSGAGISMINWAIDRPFVFFEDTVSYSRLFAVYEAAQFDSPAGNPATPAPGPGLGHSFFTVRVQPVERLELDFNHNYFRDVPPFDPTLIGTGLLDKFLFTGFSAGARIEVARQVYLSTTLGRSNRSGDKSASLNEMYGLTFNRLPLLHIRAAANYARFNSSFGSGTYEAITLSRQMSENLRLELLAGQQDFASSITSANRSRFLTTTWETTFGPHYYLQGNFTMNRGQMNYEQYLFSIGYRFDNKRKNHQ